MLGPLRFFAILFTILAIALVSVALIASSDVFRETRVYFVEAWIEKKLGTSVVIDGDVRVAFEPELSIVATELRLPSDTIENIDLASLKVMQLALLPKRGLTFPSVRAEGLSVDLLKNEDGIRSWRKTKPAKGDINSAPAEAIEFLGEREVTISDFKIAKKDEKSGFEFDFGLDDFKIDQRDGGAQTALSTKGVLNGQDFAMKGDFPKGKQFKMSGAAGNLVFSLEGKKTENGPAGDFSGVLSLTSSDLQNLLDVFKLEAGIDGTGAVTATVKKTNSLFELTSIESNVDLANGNSVKVTGEISEDPVNALAFPDFDLNIAVDFADASEASKTAVYFTDIRPEKLSLHVVGRDSKWTIEQLDLDTNAFDEALRKIGPFHEAVIERSDSGNLQVTGIAFHVGPEDDPIAEITGEIGDLLDFRDYRFQGSLNLPSRTLLPDISKASAAELGKLTGSFKLVDKGGSPVSSYLSVQSKASKIWSLKFAMDIEDLTDPSSWDVNASFDVPNGTEFLKAMQMQPIATGAVKYSTKITFSESSVRAVSDMSVGSTAVHSDLNLSVENNAPRLTGKIHSSLAQLRDFRHAVQFGTEVSVLGRDFEALVSPHSNVGFKDFVEGVWTGLQKNTKDDKTKKEATNNADERVAIKDIVNLNNLLEANFLLVDVTVDKISGILGLSTVKSTLKGEKGNVTLSPLVLALGDGRATISSGVDLIKAPTRLKVDGKGDGWDLGDVIKEAGLKIAADGDIHAQFSFLGSYKSPKDFIDTLRGDAHIELENGEIGTSLIELAGLGILRWLFSEELARDASMISCIKANLRFDDGEISFRDAVMETLRVQLVTSGTVDYLNDTVNIEADPRGLGHPLSRSAWPFTIKGSLQDPKVRAHLGTNRRWSPQVLEMPEHRVPCVPDVEQLKAVPASKP